MSTIHPLAKIIIFLVISLYLFSVYGSPKRYSWNEVRVRGICGLIAIFVMFSWEDIWTFLFGVP